MWSRNNIGMGSIGNFDFVEIQSDRYKPINRKLLIHYSLNSTFEKHLTCLGNLLFKMFLVQVKISIFCQGECTIRIHLLFENNFLLFIVFFFQLNTDIKCLIPTKACIHNHTVDVQHSSSSNFQISHRLISSFFIHSLQICHCSWSKFSIYLI